MFKKENTFTIIEIFSNRMILIKLIKYLKEKCGLKYVEIRDYFGIPRGIMDSLKSV